MQTGFRSCHDATAWKHRRIKYLLWKLLILLLVCLYFRTIGSHCYIDSWSDLLCYVWAWAMHQIQHVFMHIAPGKCVCLTYIGLSVIGCSPVFLVIEALQLQEHTLLNCLPPAVQWINWIQTSALCLWMWVNSEHKAICQSFNQPIKTKSKFT